MPGTSTSRGMLLGIAIGAAIVIAFMLGRSTFTNQSSVPAQTKESQPGPETGTSADGGPKQTAPTRQVRFNGQLLDGEALHRLENFEQQIRQRFPDNSYWYDDRSGAVGLWGGPTAAFIPGGLQLGGALQADASTGGTGVFVNNRELHPLDVQGLSQIMPVLPGRYWVDAQGNGGYENGPVIFNLVQLANQARQRGTAGGGPWSQNMAGGANGAYVSGDGASSIMGKDPSGNVFLVGP